MSTLEITSQNAEQLVSGEGILFVDVWAPWCGPCRAFTPIYESVAAKHPDITWGKLNTQDQPALGSAMQIQAIPTLMVFRDGVLLYRQAGLLPAKALEELVGQVQALDMDEVRRELAHERADKAQA